ncbi:phosphatase PAP2 family protein [Phycicoccus sp. CSK15P-2]|uniref:phosphatase PAP2 family protein n=1 Tax=Phycicoccus sp. CSK15P-2 TaxID=2807627 RepID=UPI00194DBB4C|nr:phosphatase PAP2 family protein [Phycicoccus sp. CSK15P-2]MBM6403400.1 phosphatase PAP2 family protein [Phycicoccus sp. CSK15P-2]
MTSTDAEEPPQGRARRLARAAVYAVVTALVLFGVGFLVRSRWDPLIALDDAVIDALTSVTRAHPAFLDALIFWQEASQPFLLHVLGTLLCLWVWLGRGMRTRAWWAFATLMVSWAVGLGAKYVFQRARPVVEDPVSEAPGYSFPSGHALNSAAWTTTVVILLWPVVRSRAAPGLMVGLGVVFVVLTALDRNFLGVHYPSDVTVGVLTGVGLVLASYAGYTGWNPRRHRPAPDPDLDAVGASEPAAPEER